MTVEEEILQLKTILQNNYLTLATTDAISGDFTTIAIRPIGIKQYEGLTESSSGHSYYWAFDKGFGAYDNVFVAECEPIS